MSTRGIANPTRASVLLTDREQLALRKFVAREGLVLTAKRFKIARETIETASTGGRVREDTAERIRAGLTASIFGVES